VAVEVFFEQPHRMASQHEELFEALVAFFQLDPRTGRQTQEPVDSTDESGAGRTT
jgi:Mlc titration factor MtfA (ptsG expression regulator)